MKTLLVFSLLLFLIRETNAQSDTTQNLPDSVLRRSGPDPESWYNSALPKDAAPAKDSVIMEVDQLPSSLRKSLDHKKEFDGWRNGKIYFDKVNKNYKLFIQRGRNTERFTVDKRGNTLSFTSFISP